MATFFNHSVCSAINQPLFIEFDTMYIKAIDKSVQLQNVSENFFAGT